MSGQMKTARPGRADSTAGSKPISIHTDEIGYLEKTIQQMVQELRENGLLSADFVFLTRQAQRAAFEASVDAFLTALPETDR